MNGYIYYKGVIDLRIIKLKDGDAFCGYDDERNVYLFAIKDNSGHYNFECTMSGKLINKFKRVYWLKAGGNIECEHKSIYKDWLIANSVNSMNDVTGLKFGLNFGEHYGFKVSDWSSIKSFLYERRELSS